MGRRRPPLPAEPSTGRIDGLDDRGRGLARIDGRSVRVAGVHRGELVTLRLRRHDQAELLDVLEAAPERARPRCQHFRACGGCADQHIAHRGQVERKEQRLLRALGAADLAPQRVLEPLTGVPWGYRRRARLGVRYVPKKGGALIGFRERIGNRVTEMLRCEVLAAPLDALIAPLRELVSGLSIASSIPQIEAAVGDNGFALVFRHLQPLAPGDADTLAGFAGSSGCFVYLQPAGPESIVPLAASAPPQLEYRLTAHEVVIGFGPTDFVQVNAEVNRQMVDAVVDFLDPRPGERLVDLFCGLGNFTLPLARRGGRLVGIESDPGLIARARANAERNRLVETVRFESRDLDDPPSVRAVLASRPDKLLLDPPRTGAECVIEALGPQYPSRIAYVSCNPETFARDAAALVVRHGYRFDAAGVADMFPHTRHSESLGLFTRR